MFKGFQCKKTFSLRSFFGPQLLALGEKKIQRRLNLFVTVASVLAL